MTTHYPMHTQVQSKHGNHRHLIALLAVPAGVFAAAYAVWNVMKEQCAPLVSSECMAVGSMELGAGDVALLATFLAAGLAAIVEVATN